MIKSRRAKLENWTKPIFNTYFQYPRQYVVPNDFRHRVSTISSIRSLPRRNIIQIFSPIAGRQIFPRQNAISLSNDRAASSTHRSRIICPREWMKIAKNSRKRTCRRGSTRWTPRGKGGEGDEMSGRTGAIVPFTAFSKGFQSQIIPTSYNASTRRHVLSTVHDTKSKNRLANPNLPNDRGWIDSQSRRGAIPIIM